MTTSPEKSPADVLSQPDALLVAELARYALGADDFQSILDGAVELVSRRLGMRYVKVLELVPAGDGLLLTAGVGWPAGFVGQVVVPITADSQAGYTLKQGRTVVVDDLRTETRFRGMPFLHEHNIVSGLGAVIPGRERPHGIITAHETRPHEFSEADIAFLDGVASVLGAAIDRRKAEDSLRRTNDRLERAMVSGQMGAWEWDPNTGRVTWTESLERIHGQEPGSFGGDVQSYLADVHPEDRDRVVTAIGQALQTGDHRIEYRIITPAGDVRWLFARGILYRNERGDPSRMVGICSDVTDQKASEAAMRLAEQQAREAAEFSANRISRLQGITSALSEALTPQQVGQVVIENSMSALGALAGVVTTVSDDGQYNDLLAYSGYSAGLMANWQHIPIDTPTPISEAVRTASPLFIESAAQLAERFPEIERPPTATTEAVAVLPLIVEGRTIGTVSVTFDEAREFSLDEQAFLFALARLCAQALDRARLFEAERLARAEAEAAEKRQAFLGQASTILSASLDYETTLAALAELCVPYVGDWCAVDILEGDEVRRVTVVHSDPDKIELAEKLREDYPPDPETDIALNSVLKMGTPVFYPEVTPELIKATAPDPELFEIISGLGLSSVIIVPLRAGSRIVGALTLVTAESDRHYGRMDVSFAEDLGHRAGLAVENARLYAESQRIGEELRLANEAKDEFLGLVSHELRTPITTIYGGARILRSRGDRLDKETSSGVLGDIEQESERLHRIVEDLLVLARVELGEEAATEPILLQRIVERAVTAIKRRRPNRVIEIDIAKELEPVRASGVYVEQVLRNLINNADKYSPADQPIEVRAHRDGDEAIMSILDRGPGIPEQEMELIFERFYRSAGTAKQAGGAGIGLTVCKRLVEAQNGRIWAESREGGGLEVSFSLPLYDEL